VGGTINEDDHVFGLSAARKYGGEYVPANMAVLHQYAREMLCRSGDLILGSDSHTRYGPLGTMGIGEGGPELVKQLLSETYDIPFPEVVLVYLIHRPRPGVGPQDVAIALISAVYDKAFVKNKILEFTGPGLAELDLDFRFGIDVMTTETACLSSIWETDSQVKDYYLRQGRPEDYQALAPAEGAEYAGMILIDLAEIEPMIALPFHPSKGYTIREMNRHGPDLLRSVEEEAARLGSKVKLNLTGKIQAGRVLCDQGIIAGCAGGLYGNIREAGEILRGGSIGDGYFSLSVYPASLPIKLQMLASGIEEVLLSAGALTKPCFCGPCFGAGDVPAHGGLSIRHTTRNFPNREGSRPAEGQLGVVALLDARSIGATARAGGLLTGGDEIPYEKPQGPAPQVRLEGYKNRVYRGFGRPQKDLSLRLGPNITDWPRTYPLEDNVLLGLASVIRDPVTTTDELIPSGEASSYRSNPLKLAEFTLSRRDPEYVSRAKALQKLEESRRAGQGPNLQAFGVDPKAQIGSGIFAIKPGDGSAREQAASCQRVLGGMANLCREYATKRYRSNLINWGILPFTITEDLEAQPGDWVYIPGLRANLARGAETFPAKLIARGKTQDLTLHTGPLTSAEREIILQGSLMNYYASRQTP
jgi:aconitate hydratase